MGCQWPPSAFRSNDDHRYDVFVDFLGCRCCYCSTSVFWYDMVVDLSCVWLLKHCCQCYDMVAVFFLGVAVVAVVIVALPFLIRHGCWFVLRVVVEALLSMLRHGCWSFLGCCCCSTSVFDTTWLLIPLGCCCCSSSVINTTWLFIFQGCCCCSTWAIDTTWLLILLRCCCCARCQQMRKTITTTVVKPCCGSCWLKSSQWP